MSYIPSVTLINGVKMSRTIPGSSGPEHIKEHSDIFDFALSQDEVAEISALDKGVCLAPNPDMMARE